MVHPARNVCKRTPISSVPVNANRCRAAGASSTPSPGLSGGVMNPFFTSSGSFNNSARRGL